jgi:hypothetical protein
MIYKFTLIIKLYILISNLMAFLFSLVELLLLGVVALDTLGFVYHQRKNPDSANIRDYRRLIFTWVFFFALRAVQCSHCLGFLSGIVDLLSLVAKAYISIPLLKGTDTLFKLLVEDNLAGAYLHRIGAIFKDKFDSCNEKKDE